MFTPRTFWIVLGVTVVLVLGMTLTYEPPWLYRWMARELDDPASVVLARALNVVLFVPIGAVLGTRVRPRWLWLVVALSTGVELLQWWLPERHPALLDIATNSAGGALGYLLGHRWRHHRERTAGELEDTEEHGEADELGHTEELEA
jgi:hypothetical protein